MRRLAFVVALSVLVAPLTAADPGGGDAPDSAGSAALLAPGEHEGEVGGEDAADWYRVVQPEGHVVRIEAWSPDSPFGEIPVRFERYDDLVYFDGGAHYVDGGDEVRFALEPTYGPMRYWLSVALVQLPDFAVIDIDVSPVATAGLPLGVTRTITVTVVNRGADAPGADLAVHARPILTRDVRTIAVVELAGVGSGALERHTFLWDAAGYLGDIDIVAKARSPDLHPLDNVRTERTYAVVGGTPVGIGMPTSVPLLPPVGPSEPLPEDPAVCFEAVWVLERAFVACAGTREGGVVAGVERVDTGSGAWDASLEVQVAPEGDVQACRGVDDDRGCRPAPDAVAEPCWVLDALFRVCG